MKETTISFTTLEQEKVRRKNAGVQEKQRTSEKIQLCEVQRGESWKRGNYLESGGSQKITCRGRKRELCGGGAR